MCRSIPCTLIVVHCEGYKSSDHSQKKTSVFTRFDFNFTDLFQNRTLVLRVSWFMFMKKKKK